MKFSKVLRFTEILLTIPVFFCINESDESSFYSKCFVRIAFLKAIVLFVIYGMVLQAGSPSVIRGYSTEQGWGDVYTLGSVFMTRVQLQGNALLVMAYFTAFHKKDKLIYRIALFLACLVAGNKAFLIGIFLFALYFCFLWLFDTKRKYVFYFKVCIFLLSFLAIAPILFKKANLILEEKSVHSNVIRYEQAEVLLTGNIVTGNGIGNEITAKTSHREYNGGDYFEVQTLYIVNQIGFVGYLLFLLLTFAICLENKKTCFACFVYFTYLAYTFFNPYCFDTTHMIAGFLISSVLSRSKYMEKTQ